MKLLFAVVAVSIVLAAPAQADYDYSPYLNCLSRQGVVFKNPDDAIKRGRQIDRDFFVDHTPGEVIWSELEHQAGMTQDQARASVQCALFYKDLLMA
jgi:hypothetical protein